MPRKRKITTEEISKIIKRQPERKCRSEIRKTADSNNNKSKKPKQMKYKATANKNTNKMKVIESQSESQLSILDLNDDCLMEIFQNLNTLDLCAVKDTCRRFQNLSEYHFKTVYNRKIFSFRVNDRYKKMVSENEEQKILRHFGTHINKLIINASDFDVNAERVLDILGQNPVQNLKDFEIENLLLDENALDVCKGLLSNLERLSIDFCYGDESEFYKCVSYCGALKELQVLNLNSFEIRGKFLITKFQRLESLILREIKCFNTRYIDTFFKQNTNLKRIRLIRCNFTNDDTFKMIADNLTNIEEICIQLRYISDAFEDNLSCLLKLNNLKRLEFNCGQKNITSFVNFLAGKNIIEHFSISDTALTKELCEALSQLKSLKILKLISMRETDKNFVNILSEHLQYLEELYIVDSNAFAVKNVKELIENAANMKRIVIKDCNQFIPFDCGQFLELCEARRKCHTGRPLTIHLELPAFNACKIVIPPEAFRNNANHIRLTSSCDNSIKIDDLISDKRKNEGYSSYEFESTSSSDEDEDEDDHDHFPDFYDSDSEDFFEINNLGPEFDDILFMLL